MRTDYKVSHWLLLICLLPHLAVTLHYGNRLISYPDQSAYLDAAKNLLAGNGISLSTDTLDGFVRKGEPTSYYGFGAPAFYASIIAIFGEKYFWLRIGNLVLFSFSLIFFYRMCCTWIGKRAAQCAMVFLALSPFYVSFNQLVLTEMPFLCAELGAFSFLFLYFRTNYTKHLLLSAVFIGLSLLVRTNLLLFIPVIVFVIWWVKNAKQSLAYLVIIVAVVAPWSIRNCINNRAFFPFDGKAAFNLWLFNSDVLDDAKWGEPLEGAPVMPDLSGLTEKQRSDRLTQTGKEFISKNPAKFVRLMAMKAYLFLSPFPHQGGNKQYTLVLLPYACVITLGFLLGVTKLSLKDPTHLLVIVFFLYTLGIEMVFSGATRHRILYDPFYILVTFKWLSTRVSIKHGVFQDLSGPAYAG